MYVTDLDTSQITAEPVDWGLMIEAMGRQNKHLLDNFGITIKLSELPIWPIYKIDYANLYGSSWLSRLWCQHIRPRIMPARQARYEKRYKESRAVFLQQHMNAVLELGTGE